MLCPRQCLYTTGYKRVRQLSLPAETVHHIWLHGDCPQSLASCRDSCAREIASCGDCPCDLGSRITGTVSAGSHFSWTVISAVSKRSCTVSAEAKYDRQSLQEAKISGLVYTLCTPITPLASRLRANPYLPAISWKYSWIM